MGIVWEAYHKEVPLLGVPGITLEIMALQNSEAPDYDCFDAKPKLSFNRPEDPPGTKTNKKHEGWFFYLRIFFLVRYTVYVPKEIQAKKSGEGNHIFGMYEAEKNVNTDRLNKWFAGFLNQQHYGINLWRAIYTRPLRNFQLTILRMPEATNPSLVRKIRMTS